MGFARAKGDPASALTTFSGVNGFAPHHIESRTAALGVLLGDLGTKGRDGTAMNLRTYDVEHASELCVW